MSGSAARQTLAGACQAARPCGRSAVCNNHATKHQQGRCTAAHCAGGVCGVCALELMPIASDTVLGSFHAWRLEKEGQQSTICLYLIITRSGMWGPDAQAHAMRAVAAPQHGKGMQHTCRKTSRLQRHQDATPASRQQPAPSIGKVCSQCISVVGCLDDVVLDLAPQHLLGQGAHLGLGGGGGRRHKGVSRDREGREGRFATAGWLDEPAAKTSNLCQSRHTPAATHLGFVIHELKLVLTLALLPTLLRRHNLKPVAVGRPR